MYVCICLYVFMCVYTKYIPIEGESHRKNKIV